MSNKPVTAEEAFLAAQMVLNRTATLIQSGREIQPRFRPKIKDELYDLMDQYWKYQEIAMNAQGRSKL
jgi:hypothetical protein